MARGIIAMLVIMAVALPPDPAFARSRTLDLYFTHTRENLKIVYKRNGRHVPSALRKINRFLRDWRRNESTKMDPELLDLLWDVQQEFGGRTIHVVSAYRSPATNRMLRRRSRGVASKSQHMVGRAIDFYIKGVDVSKLREAGMRRQVGGVGYYPRSGTPFVHFDTGSVRAWPRMSRRKLAKVFPDGETLHLPKSGKPLANYTRAKKLEEKGKLAKLDGGGGSFFGFGGGGQRTVTARGGRDSPFGDRVVASAGATRASSTQSGTARQDTARRESKPEPVQTASLGNSPKEEANTDPDDGNGGFVQLPSVSLGGLINRFRGGDGDGDEGSEGANAEPDAPKATENPADGPSMRPVPAPRNRLTSVADQDPGAGSDEASEEAVANIPVPRIAPRERQMAAAPRNADDATAQESARSGQRGRDRVPPSNDPPRAASALAYARPGETGSRESPLSATTAMIPSGSAVQPLPTPEPTDPPLAALVSSGAAVGRVLSRAAGATPEMISQTRGLSQGPFATLSAPNPDQAARGGLLTAQGFLGRPSPLRPQSAELGAPREFTGLRLTVYARSDE